MNEYDRGDLVRCTAAFTNTLGAAIDPTAVFFKVKKPGVAVATLQYGVDGSLAKDSTGNYHVDVDADKTGKYNVRWYSTGSGQAAGERQFKVTRSNF